jgi:putative phage-type endonuclease
MKKVQFEQGSESWHLWRTSGIGASEISVIMGTNKYKTPLQLWEIKCGFRKEDFMNAAMQHGVDNEDMVRCKMSELLCLNLQPICIEDDEHSFMKASLDGYDEKHEVVCEIKCPSSAKILDNAKKDRAIPDYWFDQVQWQIMLAKPKRAFIVLWDHRDDEFIVIEQFGIKERMDEMREKATLFWNKLKMGIAPDAQKGDHEELADKEFEYLLESYALHANLEKEAKSFKEKYKEKIVAYCQGRSVKCAGFTVSKLDPRTGYDLEKMRMDGIDIDKYKKEPGEGGYKINVPKIFNSKPLC